MANSAADSSALEGCSKAIPTRQEPQEQPQGTGGQGGRSEWCWQEGAVQPREGSTGDRAQKIMMCGWEIKSPEGDKIENSLRSMPDSQRPSATGSTAPPGAAPGLGGSHGSSAACHGRVGPSATSAPCLRSGRVGVEITGLAFWNNSRGQYVALQSEERRKHCARGVCYNSSAPGCVI